MKKILLSFILFLLTLSANGQQLDVSERWIMNERLVDLVDGYERFSRFDGRSDAYSFLSLFRSSNVKVYCDYLASNNFGKQIAVSNYIEESKGLEDRRIRISNLSKSPLEYRDGRWHTKIEFDKFVEYEDTLGFTFSTVSPMAGGDFHIVMECVWHKDDEEFRIENISGTVSPSFVFPENDFHVVERKNEVDSRILYNGKHLEFNEYGFAILQGGGEFDVDDDDFVLTKNISPGSGRYDLYSFKLVPKRGRARAYVAYSPGAYSVTSLTPDLINNTSFGVEIGAEIGYAISLSKASKLGLYVGAGLAHSSINLNAKNVSYSYTLSNAAGVDYSRHYRLDEATEGINLTDFVLPFFLSWELNLGKKVAVVIDAGAKVYLGLSASPRPYHIAGMAVGEDGVESPIDTVFDEFIFPNQNSVNQFAVSIFGKGGVDFSIGGGKFAFLHAGWEQGLTDSYPASPSVMGTWYNGLAGVYPLVLSGENDIATRSFLSTITYKRKGLVVEAGIRFKFGK